MRSEFINLIKSFEGFRATPYKCPAGHLSIGYGHVIRDPQDFVGGIHSREAHVLLCQDLENAHRAVLRMVRVPLTLYQQEALTSFVFNLGAMAFHRSTLRAKVNRGHHHQIPKELRRWIYCAGRKMPGLIVRRAREASWYQGIGGLSHAHKIN